MFNLIFEQWKVGELRALVQALYLADQVERQVEPLQIDEVFEALNLHDDVVVKLKLGQVLHALQIIDFNDVYTQSSKI